MKEVVDKVSKRWIHLEVTEPVTITARSYVIGWTNSYTSYLIRIENNHWAFSKAHSEVRRRFSDFCWLRSKLQEHHPNKVCPPLPPKHLLHITNFDPIKIQERCNGLEKFLQRVLRSFVFLSDAALHLFLQSDLTIQDIEEKLVEEIKPKVNYTKRILPTLSENVDIIKSSHKKELEFNGSCSSNESTSSSVLSHGDLDCEASSSPALASSSLHSACSLGAASNASGVSGCSIDSGAEEDGEEIEDDDGYVLPAFQTSVRISKAGGNGMESTSKVITKNLSKLAIAHDDYDISE